MRQAGLFGLSDHLKRLSAVGDPLEELGGIIDFEVFRATLIAALAYGDGSKGGRPPYDPVVMLKVLILAAQNNVADARMEYLIRDRLSWLRFLGFDLGAPTPDANTIRLFREKLTEAGALDTLFADFDRQLKERGYLAMGGQIVDATLVAAPKQRNTQVEKDAIWTLKFAKGRPAANGKPQIDIAIPSFGYKSSIAICRTFGFIRKHVLSFAEGGKVTDGARFDGRMLRDVVTKDNTASDVWGRYGLSQPGQREVAQSAGPGQPNPSQEAKGQADAGSCPARECIKIEGPRPGRACVCAAEGQNGPVHPHHRDQARRGENRARQSGVQYEPPDLPRATGRHGISASRNQEIPQRAGKYHGKLADFTDKPALPLQIRSNHTVNGGTHLAT
jgi:IS5 family transposase